MFNPMQGMPPQEMPLDVPGGEPMGEVEQLRRQVEELAMIVNMLMEQVGMIEPPRDEEAALGEAMGFPPMGW